MCGDTLTRREAQEKDITASNDREELQAQDRLIPGAKLIEGDYLDDRQVLRGRTTLT